MTDPIADGWSAADIDPDELVDDDWIRANTTPGRQASPVRGALARARSAVATIGCDPHPDRSGSRARRLARRFGLQRGGLTRDQMRRIAARTGYPYVEAWSAQNKGAMSGVWGALIHHTGTAWSAAGDYPTLRIVRDGRSDLQNSLCAFGLGRSGTIYLVSEKLSWHAGAGNWNGLTNGNGLMVGIEAESDGVHWTDEERDAYPRLVASILIEIGQDDKYTTRHASYALPKGRKTDASGLDMDAFWRQVYAYLAKPATVTRGGAPSPAPTPAPTPAPSTGVPALPEWPAARMPAGHYFGLLSGPAKSHGGGNAWEKPFVQAIQRRLIAKGYVPGVKDWRSGWADGKFEQATADAVARFQRAELPRTTIFGQVWADDYRQLAR